MGQPEAHGHPPGRHAAHVAPGTRLLNVHQPGPRLRARSRYRLLGAALDLVDRSLRGGTHGHQAVLRRLHAPLVLQVKHIRQRGGMQGDIY